MLFDIPYSCITIYYNSNLLHNLGIGKPILEIFAKIGPGYLKRWNLEESQWLNGTEGAGMGNGIQRNHLWANYLQGFGGSNQSQIVFGLSYCLELHASLMV